MSIVDRDAAGQIPGDADAEVVSHATHDDASHVSETDAAAAADRVAEQWLNVAQSLIQACALLVEGLTTFAEDPVKLEVYLARLVAKRVFSEDEVRARHKTNGKLSMLKKIGLNANTLLQPALLRLLPAYYSVIYQICFLIEEVSLEEAVAALVPFHDITRDDVIKVREALAPSKGDREPVKLPPLDDDATQIFAVHLSDQEVRVFAADYADFGTLDKCLRRPPPADNAGLVAIVPIRTLGTFERVLMPLLGFSAPTGLFLEAGLNKPEITDRNVIIVAQRGGSQPRPLTAFPSTTTSVLCLANHFFPDRGVRCQLFANARADGWSTLIGDENWHQKPSVR